MSSSCLSVWLLIFVLKWQYAATKTPVERGLRLNDTVFAVADHSEEMTCSWLKPKDIEDSHQFCLLMHYENNTTDEFVNCSDQRDDSKNIVYEGGAGSSAFVNKVGVTVGFETSSSCRKFATIQALVERTTEEAMEVRDSTFEPEIFYGQVSRVKEEHAEYPSPGRNTTANQTCVPGDVRKSSSTPSMNIRFPHDISIKSYPGAFDNEAVESKNVKWRLLKQASQFDDSSGLPRKQTWQNHTCEDAKILRMNPTGSFRGLSGKQSKERYVYFSKEDEEQIESEWDNDDEVDEGAWQREMHKMPTHESIVGGEMISIKKMPFMVFILSKEQREVFGLIHIKIPNGCGGAIIAAHWVLTAAHFFIGVKKPSHILVYAGVTHWFKPMIGDKPQFRKGARVFQHPAFVTILRDILNHPDEALKDMELAVQMLSSRDIALIKVWKPFFIDRIYVSTIKIRGHPWFETVRKENCTAAGWGAQQAGPHMQALLPLQRVNVAVLHGYTTCPCMAREPKQFAVCMEKSLERGFCFGDSGSPLLCDGEVVGVARAIWYTPFLCLKSLRSTDPDFLRYRCTSEFVMNVFTYTCPYLDWIRSHVGAVVPPKPDSCSAVRVNSEGLIIAVTFSILVEMVAAPFHHAIELFFFLCTYLLIFAVV